jgi:hypothetical protein
MGATYPIVLPPGRSKQITIQTLLDTAGGKTTSNGILTIISNADNTISPIPLTITYIYPKLYSLSFGASSTDASSEVARIPLTSKGITGIRTIDFDLNYNTDILEYFQSTGINSVTSANGVNFHLSGNPFIAADANGVLAELDFRVYISKDSMTFLRLANIHPNADDPKFEQCIAQVTADSSSFTYQYICGSREIRSFLRGDISFNIISLHPNPSQDAIDVGLHSAVKLTAQVEIFDALGVKVLSTAKNLLSGVNNIHLNTRSLMAGVYLMRITSPIGTASQEFVKIK